MKSPIGSLLNKTPVPYAPRRRGALGLSQTPATETAQLAAMGSVGTLYAIVDRISEAVSRVEWKLYRTSEDGRRSYAYDMPERREVTRHLALQVWQRPNPYFTRQVLVEAGQQHFELTGETFWLVAKDPRSPWPGELWPVRPDRIAPIPHPTDFLSGFVYSGPDGEKVPLGTDEVIWLRRPHPTDPYRGISPVDALLADLDATRYSAEWNRNFFLNSAEPGGIIQVPESLSDPEFDEMRERWNEQHRGVAAAHRVAILEKGQWVDRKFTQRDMQFAELRDVSREVIREAYAFPKAMLGTVDDVNRANAEANEVMFSRWLIKSRLDRIKEALNSYFLPLFGATGAGVEFDYCDPSPADRETDNDELTAKANAAKTLVDAGWDPDEVLETVGLPPMSHDAPEPVQPPMPAQPEEAA